MARLDDEPILDELYTEGGYDEKSGTLWDGNPTLPHVPSTAPTPSENKRSKSKRRRKKEQSK